MYSPKIREEVVRVLYRMAKDRQMPMTELVHELLVGALERSELPAEADRLFEQVSRVADRPEGVCGYLQTECSLKDERSSP